MKKNEIITLTISVIALVAVIVFGTRQTNRRTRQRSPKQRQSLMPETSFMSSSTGFCRNMTWRTTSVRS